MSDMDNVWSIISASDKDCEALTQLAKERKVCCEIGSFIGKTAKAILKADVDKLYCIDCWSHRPTSIHYIWEEDKEKLIYNTFCNNLKDEIEIGKLIPCKGLSKNYADKFSKIFDFIFIDANHDYKDVKFDVENWLPKLKNDGIICGHDILMPDVRKAVSEIFTDYNIVGNNIWYIINK